MKISTKGRYGTRLMLYLARKYGKGPVLLKEVAEFEEISEKYLGHMIPLLKTAGLISATRGAHGGYSLAREPRAISLTEVILALEGSLTLVECVASPDVCTRVSECVTRDIWGEMSIKLMEVLDATNLEDMVKRYRQKQQSKSFMYSI